MSVTKKGTKPPRLDRDRAQKRMKSMLGAAAALLERHVDRSVAALYEFHAQAIDTYTSQAGTILYHDFIESLDATDVLLRSGAVGPARVQARTVIETAAQAIHLIDRNDEHVSLALVIQMKRKRLDQLEALVASIAAKLDDDDAIDIEDRVEDIRWANELFEQDSPVAATVARMLDELVEQRGLRDAMWYQIRGGPRTLRELFGRVGFDELYEACYRPWSEEAHGRNLNRASFDPAAGEHPLRRYSVEEAAVLLIDLDDAVRRVTRRLYEYFRPGRAGEYDRWVETEVELVRAMLRMALQGEAEVLSMPPRPNRELRRRLGKRR